MDLDDFGPLTRAALVIGAAELGAVLAYLLTVLGR